MEAAAVYIIENGAMERPHSGETGYVVTVSMSDRGSVRGSYEINVDETAINVIV